MSKLKHFTLASLISASSFFGCSEENVIQKPELGTQIENNINNNYIFTPVDSVFSRERNKDYKDWSILLGMDLDGTVFGLNTENKNSLQEFTVAQKSYFLNYIHIPFGSTLEGYTRANYLYSEYTTKQIVFAAKSYIKDNFEFLGADWIYGAGGGLKFALNSRRVMLVDSSIVNELYQGALFPSISLFTEVGFDKRQSGGIKFIFDSDLTFPTSLQISIMFRMNID